MKGSFFMETLWVRTIFIENFRELDIFYLIFLYLLLPRLVPITVCSLPLRGSKMTHEWPAE